MTRVRCYYRYSSDEQSDGWSIAGQDDACKKFIASRNDWEMSGPPYVDEAWSGKTVHRPAFQQMLSDAQAGQFDVLVCHKLDRFSRSLVDVLLTLDELQQCNVTFASASEPVDFTTPIGRMMLVILAYFAEWYLQNLSAETTKGKRARFEAGYWNGDLRFGYSKVQVGEEQRIGKVKKFFKPVPNDDAKHVVTAYELCAAGKTDSAVADALNRAGARTYRLIVNAKTKAGPEVDPTKRRPWVKDSALALFTKEAGQFYLGNTVYIGEKERKKAEHLWDMKIRQGTHEAIITQDQYDRAMAARAQRNHPGRVLSSLAPRIYLLGERIAHCAWCGKPMRCTNSKMGQGHLYYRCAAHFRAEPCEGSRLRVREEEIAPQITDYINALSMPDDWRDRVTALLTQDNQAEQLAKRRESLRTQLKRLNHQYEHGLISEEETPEYERKAQKLIREINGIVIPNANRSLDVGERLISFAGAWGKASLDEQHAILKELFEAAYINTNTEELIGVRPFAEFVPIFKQTTLIEVNGVFMLGKSETAEQLVRRLGVSNGSDGVDMPSRNTGLALAEDFFILVRRPVVTVNNGE